MSALPPDPYKALGVSKDAQLPEIRSAHRKLVLKCHPDKVQDPELKAQKQDEFQKVQQAYELLSNEKERSRYDDQVRLSELREQLRAKAAATSSSRSSGKPTSTGKPTFSYEIHTNDRAYKTTTPSSAKVYSYSRSYEENPPAPDFFGERTVRREQSYQGKPSKREERERERERELRERDREIREREKEKERERERERERRKKADEAVRRAEKEAKEARRAEKKQKEKERDKDRKRESEDKKRHAKPYIESYDSEDAVPKSEKKKSSKKHEERRDRSTHREEVLPTTSSIPPPPMPSMPTEHSSYIDKSQEALNYIQASRQKRHHMQPHMQQPPAAPTPPPVSSPFAAPDEDARRSSAKPRRGSSGEKGTYKKPSKEVLEDPIVADASPSTRPHAQKAATSAGVLSGSPPRRDLPRTPTMPNEGYSRQMPNLSRSQTYSGYPDPSDPRGRSRSKLHPQIAESDSEEDSYERQRRERKHRSSKKHRSPEPRGEHIMQYRVDGGRTTLQNSYSRSAEHQMESSSFAYYPSHAPGVRVVEARPTMPSRDATYSNGGYAKYSKYKTSKAYDFDDVQYSQYPSYREELAYPAGVA
ncbi:domain-containing [Fusarium albosuccineum]|uniref:Domain-containing n=1 Tax=Fusarium albosuccineum TaxID=1237068 RepID=A0A8H4PHR9_9HYPO|nr:domain-containing [Fusarium albosuccineum]